MTRCFHIFIQVSGINAAFEKPLDLKRGVDAGKELTALKLAYLTARKTNHLAKLLLREILELALLRHLLTWMGLGVTAHAHVFPQVEHMSQLKIVPLSGSAANSRLSYV